MAIAERLPGMVPGRTTRNIVVAIAYVHALLIVVALTPVLVGIAVWRDYRGAATRLQRLPGISREGGVAAGAVAFGYCVLAFAIVGAISGPSSSTDPSTTSPAAMTTTGMATTLTTAAPTSATASPTAPTPTSATTGATSTPTATERHSATASTAEPTTTTVPPTTQSATQPPPTTQPPSTTRAPTTTQSPSTTHTPSTTRSPPTTTAPATTTESGWDQTFEVTEVVDGDTLDVEYPNGSTDTVRLIGVDTPEVHVETQPEEFEGVPDTEAGHQCLRAEGHDASEYVTQQLSGETISVSFDDALDRRGAYGRLLVYVHVQETTINHQLVEQGYGRVYDSAFTRADRYYDAEATAQESSVGVWECRDVEPTTPTTTTATTTTTSSSSAGTLAISQIHADAAGNDHENENDEYIVFENTGDTTLDLSGWTVEDEADHTYTFPSGTTLAAGAELTLYTGSGTDTETEVYWGSDSAIWNNGGDTVTVRDTTGSIVVQETYS